MAESLPDSLPLHRTLVRQLRRLGLSQNTAPDDAAWAAMLAVITQTYAEVDADRYTLERSIEVSSNEMRGLHDMLRRQALHDELTGLPNRAALMERLSGLLAACPRGGPPPSLLFIDLDGFKLVNDTLGHEAGDDLLVRVAERLRSLVRPDDLVARLGGDEFVIVLGRGATAEQVARRVTRELGRPFLVFGRDTVVSASVGVAVAHGAQTTPEELLGQADLAMYTAKTEGRSRFVFFTAAMQAAADERLSVKSVLRAAIAADELFVEYQPLVRLSDLSVLGAEALVRWRRPEVGIASPREFIPAAEEARLIGAVDEWVLTEACRRAAGWCTQGGRISVNLSSQSLDSADLPDRVRAALEAAGVMPSLLSLEFTETSLLGANPIVLKNLELLRDLGVLLVVDDFGTGYSSLARLRAISVHSLKLDRSLIDGMDESRDVAAVVAAAISMAHALGHQVVAEGVERQSQLDLLRAMGCDDAQGYLFGRPGKADLMDDLIGTRLVEQLPSGRQARIGATGRGLGP